MDIGLYPAGGGSVYTDAYRFDNEDVPGEGQERQWGPALQLNGGIFGFLGDDDSPFLSLTAVGRAGLNIDKGPENYFGSVGVRGALIITDWDFLFGGEIAAETGYRVNSKGEDHPYLGLEGSFPLALFGPVIGMQLNPENFGKEGEFWHESSIYLGGRIFF